MLTKLHQKHGASHPLESPFNSTMTFNAIHLFILKKAFPLKLQLTLALTFSRCGFYQSITNG